MVWAAGSLEGLGQARDGYGGLRLHAVPIWMGEIASCPIK